jgi:hypothetical protein
VATGELVEKVVAAHGGQQSWSAAGEIRVHARSSGLALASKGARSRFREYDLRVTPDPARSVFEPYPRPGKRGVFEEGRVRVESEDGETLSERHDPRPRFRNPRRLFYWDPLDSLYFAGYAMWNYLTMPLLLTRPDVDVREGEAWQEAPGEIWSRLEVSFPEAIHTHCRAQTFYFDREGLLRRHDYTAEPFGSWATSSHYSTGHKEHDGVIVATNRRVVPRNPRSNRAFPGPTLVRLEIDDLELRPR